jgi:hypothetical protein
MGRAACAVANFNSGSCVDFYFRIIEQTRNREHKSLPHFALVLGPVVQYRLGENILLVNFVTGIHLDIGTTAIIPRHEIPLRFKK